MQEPSSEGKSLERLLHPDSIAIIGVARAQDKIGNVILRNLEARGYTGKVYPINPRATTDILGKKTYSSLEEVPGPIDLAVVALPAGAVVDSVRQCAAKKVGFVIVISGGFSETGEAGKAMEKEIFDSVKNSNTRVIGPNTVGVYVPDSKVSTALTLPERSSLPPSGKIGFISQSGALGLLTLDSISEYGLGISAFVNIGNRIDLSEEELIENFASDQNTRSIVVYLESFHNGKKFFEIARKVIGRKPIVLLKGGRTDRGAKAASLHTGALSTNEVVVEGALQQIGITRAYDETELMDYGKVLAYQRPVHGRNVAILTTAGGIGVITSDYVSDEEATGLAMARFSDSTKSKIRDVITSIGSCENPVDLTSEGSTEDYGKVLKILNGDDGVDAILVYALFQTARVDQSLIEVLREQTILGKPTVVGIIGSSSYVKNMLVLAERYNIPAYPSIPRVVKALKVLFSRGAYLQKRGYL